MRTHMIGYALLVVVLLPQHGWALLSPSTGGIVTSKIPLRRRGGALSFLHNTSPLQSRSDKEENGTTSKPKPPVSRFLRSLFLGLTYPFPTLRKLALDDTQTTDQEPKISVSLREAIFAMVLYLTLGAISYHSTLLQGQPWSLVDAIYFSVVTFTTVGYGDVIPSSPLGKAFTIFFGLTGISILGLAIAALGSKLIEVENRFLQKAQAMSRKQLLGFWNKLADNDDDDTISSRADNQQFPKTTLAPATKPLWIQTLQSIVSQSVPAVFVVIVGGLIMGHLEGWSIFDSIYYAFITAATLGYGDFSPMTPKGRLCGIFFIPLSVAALGEILGTVGTALQERRQAAFFQSLFQRELDVQRLLDMDTDHNGKVSREEYLTFMLQEMELVSSDELDELQAQFRLLDRDGGGYLDKEDLQGRVQQQR